MPKPPEPQGRRPGANIIEIVRLSWDSLRKSERKVADLVLADPQTVLASTVADVAGRAGVSQPTVIRFCVGVGCSGFHEFRLRLAQSLALGTPATHSVILKDDRIEAVVEKVFDFTLTSLDWARHHLDHKALVDAVDLLVKAQTITFIGFGASGIVALDAEQKFPLFGIPCRAETDAHQQVMTAAMMRPEDVLVAISNTGLSEGVIAAARIARARGAAVIALTGNRATLSDHATLTLLAETLDNTDVFTPTTSRVAALVVIDILASTVALRRGQSQFDSLQAMKRTLAGYRQG